MTFEADKTFLLFFRDENLNEVKKVIPLVDISVFVNKKANKIILFFDKEIDGLYKEFQDFCLDITNDPLADPKFPITNLGYFSMRFSGKNCKSHQMNGKTIVEFSLNNFDIFFNIPMYLPLINEKNFVEQLNYNNENLFFLRFEFKHTNHNMIIKVFRENVLNKYNVNFLKIENNCKKFKSSNITIFKLLKRFELI